MESDRFERFQPPPHLRSHIAEIDIQESGVPVHQRFLPELGLVLGFQFRGLQFVDPFLGFFHVANHALGLRNLVHPASQRRLVLAEAVHFFAEDLNDLPRPVAVAVAGLGGQQLAIALPAEAPIADRANGLDGPGIFLERDLPIGHLRQRLIASPRVVLGNLDRFEQILRLGDFPGSCQRMHDEVPHHVLLPLDVAGELGVLARHPIDRT